jgi:hypothetical protein
MVGVPLQRLRGRTSLPSWTMTKFRAAAPGAFREPVHSEFAVYVPVVCQRCNFAAKTHSLGEGEAAATVKVHHADAGSWNERADNNRNRAGRTKALKREAIPSPPGEGG